MNKLNSINKVTIKPILYCPARCEFCIPRRDNYRRLRANSESQMRICDYEKLIVELATLGVQEICISGGEPTLYKHLDCLVRSISLSNIKVSLNTNGFNLLNRLSKLIDSGLNCVGLSLYSNKIDIQDQLKKLDGIGAKAISLIKQFNNLDKKKDRSVKLYLYCILLPQNAHDLYQYLAFAEAQKVDGVFFSPVQGKLSTDNYYLSENNICTIEREIYEWVNNTQINLTSQKDAIFKFLDNMKTNACSIKHGVYKLDPDKPKSCEVSKHSFMILANGDVHACNMIEMAGEPPLGNINNSSLKEILYGDSKKVFDNNVHKMCKYCAMSNTILIEMT